MVTIFGIKSSEVGRSTKSGWCSEAVDCSEAAALTIYEGCVGLYLWRDLTALWCVRPCSRVRSIDAMAPA